MKANDDSYQNFTNRIEKLKQEKEKLRDEFRNGNITVDEYVKKMRENDIAMTQATKTLSDYELGLAIVRNGQMSYIEKINEMNALKLNPSAFAALIMEIQNIQDETLKALKLKQLLLDQTMTDGGQNIISKSI